MKRLLLMIMLIAMPVYAQEVTDEPFPPEGWNAADYHQLSIVARGGRAALLRDLFAPVYDLMSANTGHQPVTKLMIVENGLLPGCFQDENGDPIILMEETPEPCSATTVDLMGYDLLEPAQGETLERALSWTLFERFYSVNTFPAWFASGLADFYTPISKGDRLLLVRSAARSNRLFSLAALEQRSDDPLWRAQSYGMILYIFDRVGVRELFTLAAGAGDFRDAYQRHVGEAYSALLPNWQNWIFTRAAEVAHGITPYQSPTLIPTASTLPTATLTLPPAPTESPTMITTPTRQRAPTLTPSHTPTPYPATVTPRPPGSPLIAPTEVPAAPSTFALPSINIVVVLIVLLVILILVYVVLSYRR